MGQQTHFSAKIQGWMERAHQGTFDLNPKGVHKFQGGGATFWHSFIALAVRYFSTKIVQNIGGGKRHRKMFVIFMIIVMVF